jgi:hypothetical protein
MIECCAGNVPRSEPCLRLFPGRRMGEVEPTGMAHGVSTVRGGHGRVASLLVLSRSYGPRSRDMADIGGTGPRTSCTTVTRTLESW